MSDDNARELIRLSEARFNKKQDLDDLCQRVAEEICPQRADFTVDRTLGDEFAQDMYTSMPAQWHRDLSYAMGALTRPKNQNWFDPKAKEDARNTELAKAWLAQARDKQRTLLYSHRSNFQGALEISDRDVTAFGNAVVGHAENPDRDGLMVFTTYHFRDCAWAEDHFRTVNEVWRKFKIALCNYEKVFRKPMPSIYRAICDKDPHHEINMLHVVMPCEHYEAYAKANSKRQVRGERKKQFASVYVDPNEGEIVREGGYYEFPYTVRRWQLQDGTPYARSPAADLGLVEARLLQNQERVLMDAGELSVDPPSIAARDAIMGEIRNYPGSTTFIEWDADARNKPLEFIEHKGNMPIGLEMKKDTREVGASAMFINKLSLPVGSREMTVPEVNERISEYIRSIGPAVEPFEAHNGMLLDSNFTFNLRIGQFGPMEGVPRELAGAEIIFEFDGPIQIAYKRQKLNKIGELATMVQPILQVKPEVADNFDWDEAARKGAEYIGVDPAVVRALQDVATTRDERAKLQEEEMKMAKMERLGKLGIGALDAMGNMNAADQNLQQMLGGLGIKKPQIGGDGQEQQQLLLPPPGGGGGQPPEQDPMAAMMGAGAGGGWEDLAQGYQPELEAMMTPQGGGFAGPMQPGDYQGATEYAPAPVAAPPEPVPLRARSVKSGRADSAMTDLIALLKAPIKFEYDKSGKPVSARREA